jgi:hypothetical protein
MEVSAYRLLELCCLSLPKGAFIVRIFLDDVCKDAQSIALVLFILNVASSLHQADDIVSLYQFAESNFILCKLCEHLMSIEASFKVLLVL